MNRVSLMPSEIPLKEFWLAIRTNDTTSLKSLCTRNNLPTFSHSDEGNHLLSIAMGQSADINSLRFLVEHGVNPYALSKGHAEPSPLNKAIQLGRLDYFDFLLNIGVDPNHGFPDRHRISLMSSSTPVDLQLEFLNRLIAHGVDLNVLFPLFGDAERAFTALDHAQYAEVKSLLRFHGALTGDEVRVANP